MKEKTLHVLAIALVIILATISVFQTREVKILRMEIQALRSQEADVATAASNATSTADQVKNDSASTTKTISKPEPNLKDISTSTREMLAKAEPFSMGDLAQVIELGSGRVVALFTVRSTEKEYWLSGSVWFVDLNTMTFQKISEDIGGLNYGNALSLSKWENGALIRIFTSPGEAVSTQEDLYIDASGRIAGKIKSGDYEHDGSIVAEFGGRSFRAIPIFANEACQENPDGDWPPENWKPFETPTTTMVAVMINNEERIPLLRPIVTQCEGLYGGGYANPDFRFPMFDGRSLIVHIPGYDVEIAVRGSASGSISYTPRSKYYVDNYGEGIAALLGEDRSGYVSVMENVWLDPVLSELQRNAPNRIFFTESAFEEDGIVPFRIELYGDPYREYATVEYNVATKKFQNPRILEAN